MDMEEVVDLSNDLLDSMEEDGVPISLGAASAALTVGRLIHDKKMTFEQGETFIKSMLDFTKMYFAEGQVQ